MLLGYRSARNVVLLRQLRIDWTNSIANGLLGCWVPGVNGVFDVTRQTAPMGQGSAGAPLGVCAEGPGLSSTALNQGYVLTAPTAYKALTTSGGALSVFWRGYQFASPTTFATIGAITYDNVGAPPYFLAAIGFDGSAPPLVRVFYDTGSTQNNFTGPASAAGLVDYSFTALVGGNIFGYVNGVQFGTGGYGSVGAALSTSQIQWETGNSNSIGTIMAMWNRQLSATEILSLHLDPYQFLVSADVLSAFNAPMAMPLPFVLMPQIVT
jgi:hypothetical protein